MKIIMLAVLFISFLTLLGCEDCNQKSIANEPNGTTMREMVSNSYATIYVVKIDGEEYIVVLGGSKAAICPKTK